MYFYNYFFCSFIINYTTINTTIYLYFYVIEGNGNMEGHFDATPGAVSSSSTSTIQPPTWTDGTCTFIIISFAHLLLIIPLLIPLFIYIFMLLKGMETWKDISMPPREKHLWMV